MMFRNKNSSKSLIKWKIVFERKYLCMIFAYHQTEAPRRRNQRRPPSQPTIGNTRGLSSFLKLDFKGTGALEYWQHPHRKLNFKGTTARTLQTTYHDSLSSRISVSKVRNTLI